MLDSDRPYIDSSVVATYEPTHREVYFTFLGLDCPLPLGESRLTSGLDYMNAGGTYGTISSVDESTFIPAEDQYALHRSNSHTLVYSEKRDSFNDVYDHYPRVYLSNKDFVWSPNPLEQTKIYLHDHGTSGRFYDVTYPFSISIILNGDQSDKLLNKILANVEYSVLVRETDEFVDTGFDKVRVYNDYQDTELLELSDLPDNCLHVKRFRKWRFNVPRNNNGTKRDLMRATYHILDLQFDNQDDRSFALGTIITSYLPHAF
jgi:hypothetical protein